MGKDDDKFIARLVEPLADIFDLEVTVADPSLQVSGSTKQKLTVLGKDQQLEVRVVSSVVDLVCRVGGLCVRVGKENLFMVAIVEESADYVQLWVCNGAVTFKEGGWTRKGLYKQFADRAVKMFEGVLGVADDFIWTELSSPANRCKEYLKLRKDNDLSSAEAFDETFA